MAHTWTGFGVYKITTVSFCHALSVSFSSAQPILMAHIWSDMHKLQQRETSLSNCTSRYPFNFLDNWNKKKKTQDLKTFLKIISSYGV